MENSFPRDEAEVPVRPMDAAEPDAPGGDETVLIVDDENAVRDLAARVLHRKGYTVVEARNAADALRICEQYPERIDLVVSDMVMPGLSGRELVRELIDMRPGMGVLFISGYADDAVLQRGVSESGYPFLAKPFTPGGLAAMVREALDRRGSA